MIYFTYYCYRTIDRRLQTLFALDGFRINLDPGDIRPSALAMAASRHQIRESDFIDAAKVRTTHPIADGHDALRIQFSPSHFTQSHVALKPIHRRSFELVADEHRPIREFHNRAYFVKAGSFRDHF